MLENISVEHIEDIREKYERVKVIEEYLFKRAYIEKFNNNNFHRVKLDPLFCNNNFEQEENIFKV